MNSVLKNMTQSEFNFLFHLSQQSFASFHHHLKEHGFSNALENIVIDANWHQAYTLDFSQCNFNNVTFKGHYSDVQFNDSQFENCKFINTEMHQATFENVQFNNVAIIESQFYDVNISNSELHNGFFLSNVMTELNFVNSKISSTLFVDNQIDALKSAHKINHELTVAKSDITWLSFDESVGIVKTDKIINPEAFAHVHENVTIGTIGNSDWHPPAVSAVSYFGADYITLNPYQLDRTDLIRLDDEVKFAIEQYYQAQQTELSIPQYILHSNQPTINAIIDMAKFYTNEIDGLWIPGNGYDIPPELYGSSPWPSTFCASDYQREIFEFALIDEAVQCGKPIIGVCHGSQMINIYFGGDLVQDVPEQWGSQWLHVQKTTGSIGNAIKNGIFGDSMHHQAVDTLGQGLEVVAKYHNVIKACQAIYGSPIMLTQFHPEYLSDQSNMNIVKSFLQAADKYHTLDTALKLADVLEMDNSLLQSLEVRFKEDKFELVNNDQKNEVMLNKDCEALTNDLAPNAQWYEESVVADNILQSLHSISDLVEY